MRRFNVARFGGTPRSYTRRFISLKNCPQAIRRKQDVHEVTAPFLSHVGFVGWRGLAETVLLELQNAADERSNETTTKLFRNSKKFLFQQDLASPHKSNMAQQWCVTTFTTSSPRKKHILLSSNGLLNNFSVR
jgi:hypothetical protein